MKDTNQEKLKHELKKSKLDRMSFYLRCREMPEKFENVTHNIKKF